MSSELINIEYVEEDGEDKCLLHHFTATMTAIIIITIMIVGMLCCEMYIY